MRGGRHYFLQKINRKHIKTSWSPDGRNPVGTLFFTSDTKKKSNRYLSSSKAEQKVRKNNMAYTNSKMVSYKRLSPNHSGKRTHSIDRITPHCVVGQCSVETLGNIFAPRSRQASCNYGIGPDGRVGMYVEEKNRSWCSSSNAIVAACLSGSWCKDVS